MNGIPGESTGSLWWTPTFASLCLGKAGFVTFCITNALILDVLRLLWMESMQTIAKKKIQQQTIIKQIHSIPKHVLNPSALAFGHSMGPDSMYYRHAHKYQRIMYKYVQDIGTPTVSRGLPKMQPQCTAFLHLYFTHRVWVCHGSRISPVCPNNTCLMSYVLNTIKRHGTNWACGSRKAHVFAHTHKSRDCRVPIEPKGRNLGLDLPMSKKNFRVTKVIQIMHGSSKGHRGAPQSNHVKPVIVFYRTHTHSTSKSRPFR